MLKIIILTLIQLLGFEENKPKNDLRKKPQKPITITPNALILLTIIGLIIFVAIILLFSPGTESGVVYQSDLI